jgi:hypothetical protein
VTQVTPAASSSALAASSVKRAAPITSLPAVASAMLSGLATRPVAPTTTMRWPVIC